MTHHVPLSSERHHVRVNAFITRLVSSRFGTRQAASILLSSLSMATKAPATRASSRTKTPTNAAPPPTRATRARTAKAVTPEPTAAAKKTVVRKPLANRDNSADLYAAPSKPQTKTTTNRRAAKHGAQAAESEREPIMVSLIAQLCK